MTKQPYRIKLLYDTPGWAYHNRCLALQRNAPDDFKVSLAKRLDRSFDDNPIFYVRLDHVF